MFLESDAAKVLRDAPSAEKALASWRGDLAHDPAARLASKTPFDHLNRSDRGTLAGVQDTLINGNRKADFAAHALMAGSVAKFNAPHTMGQAIAQLSARKLEQERATTAAVQRVEAAIHELGLQ